MQQQQTPSRLEIEPTEHEKSEWRRLAQDAYRRSLTSIGRRYSAAAALPRGSSIGLVAFDALQSGYRSWLIFGFRDLCHPQRPAEYARDHREVAT